MPTQKILNRIVTKKDGISYVYKIGNVDGYLNPTDGLFYEESTYETPIDGVEEMIYVDLPTNHLYRYDTTNSTFVIIGGTDEGGGLVYVDTLPVAPDIEDKIYGIEVTYTESEIIETTCDETNLVDAGFVIQDTGVLVPGPATAFTYQDTEIGEIDYDTSNFTIKDTEGTQIGDVLAVDDSISLVKITTTEGYEYYIGNAEEQSYKKIIINSSLEFLFNSEDFDVVNDKVSLDTSQKIKTFTQAEWDALTNEEKIALAGQNVIISDDEGTQAFEDIIPSDASASNQLVTESDISETQDIISDAWSSSKTYAADEYCISGNKLYKCLVANTGVQPPDTTYWKETTCAKEYSELTSNLTDLETTVTDATAYSSASISINGEGATGSGTVMKYGRICILTAIINPIITGAALMLATVPSSYCPIQETWLSTDYYSTSGKRSEARISTSGSITFAVTESFVNIKVFGAWISAT